MDVHAAAVVVDEAQLPKAIHEEADTRTRGSDHLGESLLTYLRNNRYRLRLLAEIGQQQEKPREAFLARIEELVNKVFFDTDVAGKQIGQKALGKFRFLMEHLDH